MHGDWHGPDAGGHGIATPTKIGQVVERWVTQNRELAQNDAQRSVDRALAAGAVRISSRRHAGTIQHISSAGLKTVQHGKNLTTVRAVIGTGGPLVFSGNGKYALSQVLRDRGRESDILLPESADFYLDRDYVFFAGGLLREVDEDAALTILKNSLQKL